MFMDDGMLAQNRPVMTDWSRYGEAASKTPYARPRVIVTPMALITLRRRFGIYRAYSQGANM